MMSQRPGRWAAVLLPYVNLLLMMLAGAGLATAARLKWDPSASIPLRLVLLQEYYVMAVLLTACPLLLLLLAVLAQAGLQSTRRRMMLLTYAAGMVLLMAGELAAGAWLGVRVYRFVTEDELVSELRGLLRLGDEVRAELNNLLHRLDELMPVTELIQNILRKMSPELADLLFSTDMEALLKMPREPLHRFQNVTWSRAAALPGEILSRKKYLTHGVNLDSMSEVSHLQVEVDALRRNITDMLVVVGRIAQRKGRCLNTFLEEIPSDLPGNLHVGVACALLCGVLQPLAALLAWRAARSCLGRQRADSRRDNDNIIMSCVRSTKDLQNKVTNVPRCLRPLSIADQEPDEIPLSPGRSKDKKREHSSRTAPRSRGWQLQSDVGWSRG